MKFSSKSCCSFDNDLIIVLLTTVLPSSNGIIGRYVWEDREKNKKPLARGNGVIVMKLDDVYYLYVVSNAYFKIG